MQPKFSAFKSRSYSKSDCLSRSDSSRYSESSSSQRTQYEGGGEEDYGHEGINNGHSIIYEEEEKDDTEMDPDDPYQINRLNDIPHEQLKELYTQVVDELLDIQLEFEEKLTEIEEQASNDIADITRQKEDAEETAKKQIEKMDEEMEKLKSAITKLSERHTKTLEQLNKERQKKDAASNQAAQNAAVDSAEVQRLKEKIEQLQDDLRDEKQEAIKLEEKYDTYHSKMQK